MQPRVVRIAYGVHGYGRGHATRVLALLPSLAERHEVRVYAGGDAVGILAPRFQVEQVPHLAFGYRGARLSRVSTFAANALLAWDLFTDGQAYRRVAERLAEFGPDVVVSDSEPLVLRAARRLGVPTIGLDHVGIIAHCRPRVPFEERLPLAVDALVYRILMGPVDRAVVSSFYEAPPRRAGVVWVGPVLRERVLGSEPSDGRHLLVYFNNDRHLYTPHVHAALRSLGRPVVVYGHREGREGNVSMKPIDEAAFVGDLASCEAVLATGGHQLISEALHLRKPILVSPEASAEQRLNAHQVEALGVGRSIRHASISRAAVADFLDHRREFRLALEGLEARRPAQAAEVLESFVRELAGGGVSGAPRTAGRAGARPAEGRCTCDPSQRH
ncbi:MAG TPA: glycosyltransferase family protein [Anaeromyxobacteraceae bacterium]|nr:glycosyltransferase family protein [Anaeromyxobacteraceae bacterium]